MKEKILFVVTSNDKKGDTGEKTGYYLSEVSHPWQVLKNAGYEIDFVSPKGGDAPAEAVDKDDPVNVSLLEDPEASAKLRHTQTPDKIVPHEYAAVFFAGGHGTMWDFPDNEKLADIAREIYENGGIVSAVCHGPAALVNVRLSDGTYLVAGKRINAFTDAEEAAVRMDKVVPFLLESKLVERGAIFEKSDLWHSHVTVDRRLVTGQNPQSATGVGEAVRDLLHEKTA